MLMSEKELIKRDTKRNLSDELLLSVKQMRRKKVGYTHKVAPTRKSNGSYITP